jgi:acyl carrier protein
LRGVVHAAGTLADATFGNITADQLRDVMRPKVSGAWNLHLSTEHLPLDFFVMFSSIASVLGSPGQGSYSGANAFLDAMAAYRQSRGLPALVVNWGPWAGDGMAAGHTRRLELLGFHPLEPARALRALESEMVERRSGHLIVAAGLGHASPREESRPSQGPDAVSVEDRVVQHIARITGISPDRIDRDRNLADLGIDSLTALELVTELEKALRKRLPLTMGAGDLSVTALASQIAQHIGT